MIPLMRNLFLGILLIILVGIGGLVYRNAAEHPYQKIACPLDAKICPDGTSLSRTGSSCTFPACPPPNVSLDSINIAYAVPDGFTDASLPDASAVAAYDDLSASSTEPDSIVIRRYTIAASSTPLATIQATAISGSSGAAVPTTGYSSTVIGSHRFTVVSIERFEGVIDTAYYLARPDSGDVLRFDAIDRNVANWTDPTLDENALPAHAALRTLLTNLQA